MLADARKRISDHEWDARFWLGDSRGSDPAPGAYGLSVLHAAGEPEDSEIFSCERVELVDARSR